MGENDGIPKKSAAGEAHAGPEPAIKPGDCILNAKASLAKDNPYEAHRILQKASGQFPDHPVILSYLGYVEAFGDGQYRRGIETCQRAITLFGKTGLFDQVAIHALLYLNLGKAYRAAGKRAEAIEAFKSGLKFDGSNVELKRELLGMDQRKKPVLSFLERSHFLNKYLGMIFHRKAPQPGKVP